MSDGANTPDLAAYLGPMSEEKQHHEAMLQLLEPYKPDHKVGFGSRRLVKTTGTVSPHYLAAVSAREVWSWIPELWRYEMAKSETLYWIIQPLRPDLRINGDLPTEENGFRPQYFRAKNCSVDAFANVPIDLDVGRPGLPTAGAAIGAITDAVQAGKIPSPTFMAHSGRGAYAIWQLREAVQNTPLNRTRWRTILFHLVSLTKDIGLAPDSNALRQAQWLKLPGTLDTKTQKRVLYLPFMMDGAAPKRYSLDELETELGLLTAPSVTAAPTPSVTEHQPLVRTVRKLRGDRRHGGYVHKARITEIVSLSNARGGMAEGVRHMTLFYYYGACRSWHACDCPGSGMAHEWAFAKTVELNATFNPPLGCEEVRSAVRRFDVPKEHKRWRADTIAKALQVSPAEAEALALSAIAPDSVRKWRKEHAQALAKSREEARLQRGNNIQTLIARHPKWSDLDIARALGGVDRRTVGRYRAQMKHGFQVAPVIQHELPGVVR